MEVEVRSVPGINTCFVSLPLHLIHALQSTAVGPLPPLLALELRSRSGPSWHVAWSGAPSRSPAIEVAQRFAECISLPNGTTAQVKVVANLPKAEVVTIEPSTEDDWEILEINAEHAEEVIWQQVGIVHEGMRFPLWLHGHTVVVFLVTSTSPKKPVVQLVPGIEVVVAPKKRKEKVIASKDSHNQILGREQVTAKALLRIQAESRQHIHWFEFEGLELGVVLTSVAFIHPETSCKLALDDLQLVSVFPRLVANEISQKGKDNNHKGGSSSPDTEEYKKLSMTGKESYKQTVVRILRSDTVAKGHIMLPQSLRLFLKVNVHSWVYIKNYNVSPKREMPSVRLSPCQFKLSSRNSSFDDDGMEDSNNNTSLKVNFYGSGVDWSLHDEIPALICKNFLECKSEDRTSDYCSAWQKMVLIEIWLSGQLKGIGSQAGVSDILSVVLPKETLFHFEVKNFKSKNEKDAQPSSDFSLNERSNRRESTIELLFLLSATLEAAAPYALQETYELTLDVGKGTGDNMHCWKTELKNLEIGDPISLSSLGENRLQRNHNLTVSSLTWMQSAITDVIDRLIVLLFPSSRRLLSSCRLPLPGHVLVCGPSGSGKTSLAMAVAKYLEEHEVILAHVVYVSCSKYYQERTQTVRQAMAHYVSEALSHSPSVIIFDDLDSIISVSSQAEAAQPSSSATVLTKFLTDMLDEYGDESQSSCGYGPIAFLATVQALGNLPQSLSSSGRFDFHVQLLASAIPERVAMLKHEICKLGLQCSEDVLAEVAPKCDGYDAYDLELLVERAIFNASSRFMDDISDKDRLVPKLMKEDFIQAMHDFVPVAMRRLTKGSSEGDQTGWQNVGGLMDIRNAIQEMVELPSKFPSIFSQAPLRLRSNMLLYGPPGCGKTHIVRAAAAAFSLRFISIKGPELLNKFIGASEQAVRELFAKAAAAAPCLLFFDEFESIAPKRGHDNTGVTDRVVNQFLTELDGVEALTGVFVFAATSRPDLLDAALLRPGRLDRLLLCDFPTWQDRLEILTVLSRKLPVAKNANLRTLASMTEGFTGADLQAILSEAQLASIHEVVDNEESHEPKGTPVISDELLRSVASRAKPSVSEAEKHKLNEIYSQFVESKKSVSSQSREAKGKRATLA